MIRGLGMTVLARALGVGLLALLALSPLALLFGLDGPSLVSGLTHPATGPALRLSLGTSALAVSIAVAGGLPLAWMLARSTRRWTRVLEALVELPVVLPPAVVGLALLEVFGRNGLLGLGALGIGVPFTPVAVVIAQVVVGAPLFVQAATASFRELDPDLLLVARTLGASPARVFWTVAAPLAAPGLISGLALAWSRAVGEFGATLLFAGNLTGRTQTLPLAVYTTLESDLDAARAMSAVLLACALAVLGVVRGVPRWRAARTGAV